MNVTIGQTLIVALLAAAIVPVSAAAPAQRKADPPQRKGEPTPPRGDAPVGESDQVKSGAEAWQAGNYTRALGIWRPLAVAGDAYAQYNLAQAYRLGRGVTVDEKIAQDWYYRAAVQGHREAQANYGLLMFQNGDRKNGLPWLRKAADQGDPRAQYVVGTALFNGDTLPKDWVAAYALMTRAAAAGLPPAVTSLSEMDKFMSLQQRQQGTALARDLERKAALDSADDRSDELVRAAPPRAAAAVAPAASPPAAQPKPAHAAAMPVPPPPAKAIAKADAPKPGKIAPPPAAKPAPVAIAREGGWRVQVGAYGDPAAAGKAWEGIARKAPGLGLRSYLVKAGPVTRLQAGPLASRADASKACARIIASGAACFPVAAN